MSNVTPILGTDVIATSRTVVNTNFSNLDANKIETSVIDTATDLASDSDAKIPSQKAVKSYVDSGGTASVTALRVLPYIYPIGALYFATVSTNPTTLLGFGTWSAYAKGRALIGAGTETVIATFASRASDVITVTGLTNAANNEFQTGQAVLYTAASGAMTGLTHNTTYYIVKVSALTFSLATTLALAQAGTVISLSSDGTGAQTFTLTLTARTGGDTGGEENHAMSSTEILAHTHSLVACNTGSGGSSGSGTSGSSSFPAGSMGSFGGNSAMNNMQPFITTYIWLRTA